MKFVIFLELTMSSSNQPGPSKMVRYGDDDYEESVRKWIEESDSEVSDFDLDDEYIASEHNSESEIEFDESMEEQEVKCSD